MADRADDNPTPEEARKFWERRMSDSDASFIQVEDSKGNILKPGDPVPREDLEGLDAADDPPDPAKSP